MQDSWPRCPSAICYTQRNGHCRTWCQPQPGVRLGQCVQSPGIKECITHTGTSNTTCIQQGHHNHTTHPSTNLRRIWRLQRRRPCQWHDLTSYQAWQPTIRWPACGLAHGGGIVTGTGLQPRIIQPWNAHVPGLVRHTWSWMWRCAETTSRLGIQPDHICKSYETNAEGGWKETARRRGVAISGQTGTWPQLDVSNTFTTHHDAVWNCQLTDRWRTPTDEGRQRIRLIWKFMYTIPGHWTFARVHRLIACHILNVIPDVSLESLMCSTLLPYNDDSILVYFTVFIVTIKLSLLLLVSYFWHCIVFPISLHLAIWRCCRLSLSKFLCHVFVASRYFCEMYLLLSIVMCMSFLSSIMSV